jgi:hypothetical protein
MGASWRRRHGGARELDGEARQGLSVSGAAVYWRGRGGRIRPLRRRQVQAGDASVSGELHVAWRVPGRAEAIGGAVVRRSDRWPVVSVGDVIGMAVLIWARDFQGVSASLRSTASTVVLRRSKGIWRTWWSRLGK